MWFKLWLGGFLAGTVLARAGQFLLPPWSLLLVMLALLLHRAWRRAPFWVACGFCYGVFHSAPFPSQPLAMVRSTQHNLLQFFYGDVIAIAAPHSRWQVRGYPHSRGYVTSRKGDMRHFIFARPPRLRERSIDKPVTPLVRMPRHYLVQRLDARREPVRSWIASVTLGQRQQLPSTLRESFRLLGLFHILVISGLHITIIAACSKKLIEFALRAFYVVRLLPPPVWFFLSRLASALSCLLILFYGCLVGFSPPAQRAVLLFVVHQGCGLCEQPMTLLQKLRLVFFLQIFFFPIGFLSDSLLLSWGAYLIVLHCFQVVQRAATVGGKLLAVLWGQLVITVLVLSFFSDLSLLSIPLNIALLPLIPYILMSGFALLLLPIDWWVVTWIEQSHLVFLQQVANLAEIASNYSWLTVNISNSWPLRVALFVVLIGAVLSRSAFLTKREKEDD